jgi:hypothetical protein
MKKGPSKFGKPSSRKFPRALRFDREEVEIKRFSSALSDPAGECGLVRKHLF